MPINFLRSGSVVTTTSLINSAFSFGGVVVLANVMPQQELGTFFLFQAALGLLSIPAAAGINGAIEKRISEGENGRNILATALVIKLSILAPLVILLLIFRSYIESYIGLSVILLFVIGLVLQEGGRVVFRVLRGEKRVSAAALLQSARIVLWISGGVFAALNGLGTMGLIYAYVGSYFVMFFIGTIVKNTGIGTFEISKCYSIISYAKHNVITSVGGQIYGWMDTAILGFFVGANLIAAYEVAWRISKLALVISNAVSQTTFPQISIWAKEREYQKIADTISKSLFPAFLISIPSFFGILLLAPDILRVVYGPEYHVAAGAFIILSFERIIRSVDQIYSRGLHAIDKPNLSVRATVVAIGANLVLNWFLIQELGIVGAALATSASFSLKFILEYRYLRSMIPSESLFNYPIRIIISSLVMFIVLLVLKRVVELNQIISLTVFIGAGAGCYFAILLLFSSMRMRVRTVISQVAL